MAIYEEHKGERDGELICSFACAMCVCLCGNTNTKCCIWCSIWCIETGNNSNKKLQKYKFSDWMQGFLLFVSMCECERACLCCCAVCVSVCTTRNVWFVQLVNNHIHCIKHWRQYFRSISAATLRLIYSRSVCNIFFISHIRSEPYGKKVNRFVYFMPGNEQKQQ